MVWGCVSGFLKGPRGSNDENTLPGEHLFRGISVNSGQERDILLLTTVWLQGERED